MSGFDDLLDPLYEPRSPVLGDFAEHVVGTDDLNEHVTVLDGDDTEIDFTTGYTASCQPHTPGGAPLEQWTHTLTSGRQIVLGNGTIAMRATAAASQEVFAEHVGTSLRMTLLVTRTSDGKTAVIWRDVPLRIYPKQNP